MAITEEEYEKLIHSFHALDIKDTIDDAPNQEINQALWDLYDKAKYVIDPEYGEFNEETNSNLMEIADDADELFYKVQDLKSSIDTIYDMLNNLTDSIPESVYEDDD